MPRSESAAYLIVIVIVAFIVTGFVLTFIATPWGDILASPLFSFDTSYGQDFSEWASGFYNWAALFSLIAILMFAMFQSRRAST